MIGHGQHARVWRESTGVVRKEYVEPRTDLALSQARREFAHLTRLAPMLSGDGSARCPVPLELIEDDPPAVRMTWCPGRPLDEHLLACRADDQELEQAAAGVAAAGLAFVRTFGYAHHDFTLLNVLFDPGSGTTTVLDFTLPDALVEQLDPAWGSSETTIGILVGSAIYTAARPIAVRNPNRSQLGLLAGRAVAHWRRQEWLNLKELRKAAWAFYGLSLRSLSRRHAWYAGPGRVLALHALRACTAVWEPESRPPDLSRTSETKGT